MIKFRYIPIIALTMLLGGCKMAVLNPKGIIAASERHLFIFATLLMLVVVVPVIVLTFVIAWRYRATNTKAKYSPEWSHSNLLEIIWWTIPCIIIIILATVTWTTTHKLDPYRPLASNKKPIIIQAIALDWKWLFIYPKQHIATVNFVQIPVDVPIRFLITSDAPMNSLEIPQLAGQIYAMTGMRTKLNLMASEAGSYRGLSTNFSGEGFSNMHFIVKASSVKQFDQWVTKAQHAPKQLDLKTYKKLAKPSENNSVAYFSAPAKNLFNKIMMKYMGPDMPKMNNGEGKMNMKAMATQQ